MFLAFFFSAFFFLFVNFLVTCRIWLFQFLFLCSTLISNGHFLFGLIGRAHVQKKKKKGVMYGGLPGSVVFSHLCWSIVPWQCISHHLGRVETWVEMEWNTVNRSASLFGCSLWLLWCHELRKLRKKTVVVPSLFYALLSGTSTTTTKYFYYMEGGFYG